MRMFPVFGIAAASVVLSVGAAFCQDKPPAHWPEFVTWIRESAHFFVAPDGKADNPGSVDAPWDIESALSGKQNIKPGDVVWLRGGVYGKGGEQVFNCHLPGTAERPIIVRQYPGERATVNGGLEITGSYNWLWGFEITNTSLHRSGGSTGGTTAPQRPGMDARAAGAKIINMAIHDIGHPCPGFWRPVGEGGEIHGCIIWANGLYPEGTYPAGSMYAQNEEGTRYITDVIAFRNFTIGVFAGSSGAANIDGFHIEGNACFDNAQWNIFLHSKSIPMKRNRIIGNFIYTRPEDDHKGSVQLGYWNIDNEDVEVRDNYIVSGRGDGSDRAFFLKQWRDAKVTGNTVVGPLWLANFAPAAEAGKIEWNGNSYYGGGENAFKYAGNAHDFGGWRAASGFDADSSHSADYPTDTRIFIRPNKYEAGRGNVIIYNWSKKESVEVDLSPILLNGEKFEVRDAQNFFGEPVIKGVFDGKPVQFPMNLTEVARPVGDVPHIQNRFRHTAPEFAVFVALGERTNIK